MFAKIFYTRIVKFKNICARHLAKISPRSSVGGVTESAAIAGRPTPEESVKINPTNGNLSINLLPLNEGAQIADSNPRSEENVNTADIESANDRPREDSGYSSNFDLPKPSNTGPSPEFTVSSSLDLGKRGSGKS